MRTRPNMTWVLCLRLHWDKEIRRTVNKNEFTVFACHGLKCRYHPQQTLHKPSRELAEISEPETLLLCIIRSEIIFGIHKCMMWCWLIDSLSTVFYYLSADPTVAVSLALWLVGFFCTSHIFTTWSQKTTYLHRLAPFNLIRCPSKICRDRLLHPSSVPLAHLRFRSEWSVDRLLADELPH